MMKRCPTLCCACSDAPAPRAKASLVAPAYSALLCLKVHRGRAVWSVADMHAYSEQDCAKQEMHPWPADCLCTQCTQLPTHTVTGPTPHGSNQLSYLADLQIILMSAYDHARAPKHGCVSNMHCKQAEHAADGLTGAIRALTLCSTAHLGGNGILPAQHAAQRTIL